MPEIDFEIQWPDGTRETCYSPSLVVKKYFTPDTKYELSEFVDRSRTALNTASDRVKAAYGFPCSRALNQLQKIESMAAKYRDRANSQVLFLDFIE